MRHTHPAYTYTSKYTSKYKHIFLIVPPPSPPTVARARLLHVFACVYALAPLCAAARSQPRVLRVQEEGKEDDSCRKWAGRRASFSRSRISCSRTAVRYVYRVRRAGCISPREEGCFSELNTTSTPRKSRVPKGVASKISPKTGRLASTRTFLEYISRQAHSENGSCSALIYVFGTECLSYEISSSGVGVRAVISSTRYVSIDQLVLHFKLGENTQTNLLFSRLFRLLNYN